MYSLLRSRVSFLKRATFALALAVGLTTGAAAVAQTPPPVHADQSSTHQSNAKAVPATDHPLIKPGDRACLRDTGSLIPPKPGACLPVAGRSYSGNELRNTGAIDNARALQMLDPSIRLGH